MARKLGEGGGEGILGIRYLVSENGQMPKGSGWWYPVVFLVVLLLNGDRCVCGRTMVLHG